MRAIEFNDIELKHYPSFTCWPDGALPLMARGRLQDGQRYFVVFCPVGAYMLIKNAGHDIGLCLQLNFPTQQCARALAKGMGLPPTVEDFYALGFREP